MNQPDCVIFDFGGVLVDWDPRHLFRKMFDGDRAGMEHFLGHVCTNDWHIRHDAGERYRDTVPVLVGQFPQYERYIRAFDERWGEMVAGDFPETVAVLRDLHGRGVPLYALTNWPGEKYEILTGRFDWIGCFRGVLVSGEVMLKKPDARIFHLLLERFQIDPRKAIYIDDVRANVDAARGVGLDAVRFTTAEDLRRALAQRGL